MTHETEVFTFCRDIAAALGEGWSAWHTAEDGILSNEVATYRLRVSRRPNGAITIMDEHPASDAPEVDRLVIYTHLGCDADQVAARIRDLLLPYLDAKDAINQAWRRRCEHEHARARLAARICEQLPGSYVTDHGYLVSGEVVIRVRDLQFGRVCMSQDANTANINLYGLARPLVCKLIALLAIHEPENNDGADQPAPRLS